MKKGIKIKANRMNLNYLINLLMLPLFLATIFTGIIKFPGFLALIGVSARRMPVPMPLLTDIHDWAGLAIALLVIVHVLLHWKMSISFFKAKMRRRRHVSIAVSKSVSLFGGRATGNHNN